MEYEHFSQAPWQEDRWPNFKAVELACPHCGEYTPRFEFTHYLARFYTPFPTIDYKSGSNSIDYAGVYTIFNDISDVI